MALRFDPSVYGQAYQQGQENELANQYHPLEALQSLGTSLGQIGQQGQERKLYELQLAEAMRKQTEEKDQDKTLMQLLSGNRISEPTSSMDLFEPPQPMAQGEGGVTIPRMSMIEKFRQFQSGKLNAAPTSAPQMNEWDASDRIKSFGLPEEALMLTPRQLKTVGESKKLFSDAGSSDFYTPEQVKAIYPQGEALSEAFGGRVPKSAVSTAALAGNRNENRELRKEQFGEQLDKETKTRYRNYLLDIEQRDPVIKEMNKQGMALGQVDQILKLARDGNTVSAGALGFKMGRAMGEVGVMTDKDVVRYVQSGMLTRGAADKLSRWINGVPTDATLQEIQEISTALQDTFQSKIQPKYDNYINSYAKIEGLAPQDFADRLSLPYGGSSRLTTPSAGGTGGAYSDPGKEKRYQEWKASQGGAR